jgi:hypothetical protein
MSLSEQADFEHCASCGKPSSNKLLTEFDDVILCGDCVDRLREGGTISYWLPTEEEPPPPPEERFAELFEAARVLLREGVTEEDQIYPTLAFANELGQGVVNFVEEKDRLVSAYSSDADSWDEAVDWFSRKHASMRPVGVVDGVLYLERIPVRVQVHNYPIADVVVPRLVTISVFPHRRSATPEQVAALYDERLSSAGIPHEQSASGQFPYFAFEDGYLLFEVGHKRTAVAPEHIGTVFRDRKPEFPHPRLVSAFHKMLLGSASGDGFARYLVTRRRGPVPKPQALIPACVAFYLRDYGDMREGAEAHRLINEHVLREYQKELPEGHSDSASNQLWRDVDKVKNKLLAAAYAIYRYDPGHTA